MSRLSSLACAPQQHSVSLAISTSMTSLPRPSLRHQTSAGTTGSGLCPVSTGLHLHTVPYTDHQHQEPWMMQGAHPRLATTPNRDTCPRASTCFALCSHASCSRPQSLVVSNADRYSLQWHINALCLRSAGKVPARYTRVPQSRCNHTEAAQSHTPEVQKALDPLRANGPISAIIVGIESHICITQTTLDLLRAGHKVYVIADAVSSCNKEEVPLALARLRHEGAVVTTSESFLYEAVGDASTPEFKQIIKLVKDTSASTKESLQTLCKI
ncbi:uncharacterized protein EKO05_0011300 [Ascochyta rabiei]|uniref:uncharacterized protein n=1 Tax=Didymella rabiei TaxID=5454 RepID=UPI00220F9881|nr:uncharacterized protein EKO05_0011300 [Ascochyta rabiei]UPX21098.1 hypothetical protein EKO05_0011300 [Ascochyta rabiei]